MFSFIAKPFMNLIQSILTNRVIKFFDRIDSIRGRYNNNNRTTTPSAPPGPPPSYSEKSDHF
jgi:hypothetical protein